MNKATPWLMSASLFFAASATLAADYQVSDSQQLQQALISAGSTPEADTLILAPGIYTTNGQPFSYYSDNGGNLTIRSASSSDKAILDGGSITEVLKLQHTNTSLSPGQADNTEILIDSLLVRNGFGLAAGIYSEGANLTLRNSEVSDNQADGLNATAALLFRDNLNNSLTIANTLISQNTSANTRGSIILVDRASDFRITDGTVISDNTGDYGILKLEYTPGVIEKRTLFSNNTTRVYGVINPHSGSIVSISDSEFINNETIESTGAGVLYSGRYQIENTLFKDNKAPGDAVGALNGYPDQYIRNSRFIGNSSTNGGVIRLGNISPNVYPVSNSLFEGNHVTGPDSGILTCNATCQIINNIFSDNTGSASVHSRRSDPQQVVVANSVFLGTNEAISFSDSSSRASLFNNFIDPQAPQLINAQIIQNNNIQNIADSGLDTENDYQLLESSPLINKGTTESNLVALPATDIRGNARVFGTSIDIGWEEYGSSQTVPVITNLSLVTSDASNLDLIQFMLEYSLPEGVDPSLVSVEVKTDETGSYSPVTLQNSLFEEVFMEGGPHTVSVKVTNNAGEHAESATQSLSFNIMTLSAKEVFDRAELLTKDLCAETPIDCDIDTDEIEKSGFNAGYADAIELCRRDPSAEDCGINLQAYVDEGYQNGVISGKQTCVDDPKACGINTGDFDGSLIPEMNTQWELFGTGQEIRNTDFATTFADAQIIWSKTNDTWTAWSPSPSTRQILQNNGVPLIQTIPANSGFWVKK